MHSEPFKMFEPLLDTEIELIVTLQNYLPGPFAELLKMTSKLLAPSSMFLILVPFIHFCQPRSQRKSYLVQKLVLSGVTADWLNTIFKWLLMGNRPYWYSSKVQQFSGTCETGPGNPSGHCMGPSAVLTVLCLQHPQFRPFVVFAMLSVAISRLYIAAHFPHQVILGILSGFAVGRGIYKISSTRLDDSRKLWPRIAVFTFVGGYGLYLFFDFVLGIDLLWTVEKAKSACANPDWIHLNTTPLNTVWAIAGLAAGMTYFKEILVEHGATPNSTKSIAQAAAVVVFLKWIYPASQKLIFALVTSAVGEFVTLYYMLSFGHCFIIPICLNVLSKI